MIGCLLGIFIVPYKFLQWCFTNGIKGLIILGVTVVILLVGILFIRSSIINQVDPVQQQGPAYELNIPDRQDAPFKVETSTRSYYTTLAIKDKATGDVTMTDWWELMGGVKWTKNEGTLVLDTQNYGTNIRITKRR